MSQEVDPRVKTIDIDGHIYKVRRWTWLEKDEVASEAYERFPGQAIGRVNLHRFNVEMMKRCIVEWPKGVTLETLDADEGDQLIQKLQEFVGGFRSAGTPPPPGTPEGGTSPLGPRE